MSTRVIAAATLVLALAGCAGESARLGEAQAPDPAIAKEAAAREAKRIAENEAARKAEEAAAAAAAAEAEAKAALPPEPSEFAIAVDVLSKKCFGSAGCNVTYRIEPSYLGTGDPNNTEVTYEVTGGEDVILDTFTIDSAGMVSYPSEDLVSTPNEGAELKAKAIKVRRSN